MTAIFQRQAEIAKVHKAIFAELVAEFKKKFPGDLGLSKEGNAWWNKAYQRMQKSQESEDLKRESADLESKLTPLIETLPTQRWLDGPETCHGYVWFYRRKPNAASPPVAPLVTAAKAAPSDSLEEPTEREPITATLSIEPARAKPGDLVTATVTVKLARDWHINPVANTGEFASPTKLELTIPSGIATAGEWDIPKPDIALVDSGPVYTGEVRFTRSLKVDSSAQAGKLELVCKLSYEACDEHRCLRPTSKTLRMPLEIQPKSRQKAGNDITDHRARWLEP